VVTWLLGYLVTWWIGRGIKKRPSRKGTNVRNVRGATPVRRLPGLKQKPVVKRRGKVVSHWQASLTRCGYDGRICAALIPFALITVATPARATTCWIRPAALRSIRRRRADRLSPFPVLCTAVSALTRPLRSLCVLCGCCAKLYAHLGNLSMILPLLLYSPHPAIARRAARSSPATAWSKWAKRGSRVWPW